MESFDTDINLSEKYVVTSISKGLPYARFMELSPRIWSKPMFEVFLEVFRKNKNKEGSPEVIAQMHFGNVLRKLNTGSKRLFKLQYPLLKDIGREFMENKGLKKGSKTRKNHGGENKMYKPI